MVGTKLCKQSFMDQPDDEKYIFGRKPDLWFRTSLSHWQHIRASWNTWASILVAQWLSIIMFKANLWILTYSNNKWIYLIMSKLRKIWLRHILCSTLLCDYYAPCKCNYSHTTILGLDLCSSDCIVIVCGVVLLWDFATVDSNSYLLHFWTID